MPINQIAEWYPYVAESIKKTPSMNAWVMLLLACVARLPRCRMSHMKLVGHRRLWPLLLRSEELPLSSHMAVAYGIVYSL